MLVQHGDGLWTSDMPAARMGVQYGARMTVACLPDGSLWLHSPVAMTPERKAALDSLGPVRHVVAPSRFHYEHVAETSRAYPEARVYAAPGAVRRVEKTGPCTLLSDEPEPAWEGVLDQSLLRGSRLYDEVDFFHRPSRTLILTDLCFAFPAGGNTRTRLFARALGILGRLSISPSFRLSIRDRAAVRASLKRILSWDFDRIVICHGTIQERGGREAFEALFEPFLS